MMPKFVTDMSITQLERILCGRTTLHEVDGPVRVVEEGGMFVLSIEEQHVLQTQSKEEALLALTLAHSVFNRRFARKLRPICMFVQKMILKIDDGSKVPAAVAKLCHEMSHEMCG